MGSFLIVRSGELLCGSMSRIHYGCEFYYIKLDEQ